MPPTTISSSLTRSKARRDQFAATLAGIAFLLVSVFIRGDVFNFSGGVPNLSARRAALVTESETSLKSLAVNFPRLTLGGFRGLLATTLWIQAEQDKTDRKWVQLETKYDIIASLQPYFTSVYIFHSWNQAYNLSAQWHDWDSKYKWVLDGLTYINKGEDYIPQNPDIVIEQGNLYFQKLGGSFERIQYRAHWRDDIANFHLLLDPSLAVNDKNEALRLVHEAVLRVPPENKAAYDKAETPLEKQKFRTFFAAELPDPTGRTTRNGFGISILDPDTNPEDNVFRYRADGKPVTDPVQFRYGLSPYYFAYIQFTRANNVVNTTHVLPTTTGMKVIDAWPAMSLRLWCRDDLFYSQAITARLFGPSGLAEEISSSSTPSVINSFNEQVAEAYDCYRNVEMIAPKSIDEFRGHIQRYNNAATHDKHIMETKAYQAIARADHELLRALISWHNHNRQLSPEVAADFNKALNLYNDAITASYAWVDFMYPMKEGQAYPPDRADSEQYAHALEARKHGIENILRLGNTTEKPDMSFLLPASVEQ